MNTVEFGMWRPELVEEGYARLNSDMPIDRIIFYFQQEFEYHVFKYFEAAVDYSDKHDIPLDIIICTSNYVKPLHDLTAHRCRNIKLHHWGTFFLSDLLKQLMQSGDNLTPEPFKYPFISMNSKPHPHRCIMMDVLAKYNFIDRGAVSWLEYPYESDRNDAGIIPSIWRGYPYRYWSPSIKKLTEVTPDHFDYYKVPYEYKQSFMQLVVESCDRNLMISEKTWMPIFYRKPFIVFAAQHQHAFLQDYGFLLYDEVFDYSFDSEPDQDLRAEAVAKNIQRYVNMPPVALGKVYKKLIPKLEYNYNLAMSLATDINRVPEIILEAYRNPLNGYCSRPVVDFIYEQNTASRR